MSTEGAGVEAEVGIGVRNSYREMCRAICDGG